MLMLMAMAITMAITMTMTMTKESGTNIKLESLILGNETSMSSLGGGYRRWS